MMRNTENDVKAEELEPQELTAKYGDLLVSGETIEYGAVGYSDQSSPSFNQRRIVGKLLVCTNKRLILIENPTSDELEGLSAKRQPMDCLTVPYRRILNYRLKTRPIFSEPDWYALTEQGSKPRHYQGRLEVTIRVAGDPRELNITFGSADLENPQVDLYRLQNVLARNILS